MEQLLAGVVRFQRDVFPRQRAEHVGIGPRQSPVALFITCADARVVPTVITQSSPGDLFVCQVVGNIVPAHGASHGGVSATIEYATTVLQVPHIVVCGHTDCGAMKVLLDPESVRDLPSLRDWVVHAEAARRTVLDAHGTQDRDAELLDAMVRQNVLTQLTNLRTHPAVAAKLAAGRLQLHGWVYGIQTGEVRVGDERTGVFTPLGTAPIDAASHAPT